VSIMDEPDLAPSFAAGKPMKCFLVEGEGCDAGEIDLIFAKSSIEAKRRWANNHDWQTIAGVSAVRKPYWDKYAGAGVPALERIDVGWCYECTGCGTTINEDYIGTRERSHADYEDGRLDREYGPDLTVPEMAPVEPIRGRVWCHQSCYESDLARAHVLRRYEERIHAWLVRRLKRRMPDAEPIPLPPVSHETYQWHAVYGPRETSYVYVQTGKRVYAKIDSLRPWQSRNSKIVCGYGVCEAHLKFTWPGAKYGPASLRVCDERYLGKRRSAQFYVANGDKEAFDAWASGQGAKA
jgi:hypothetical protein